MSSYKKNTYNLLKTPKILNNYYDDRIPNCDMKMLTDIKILPICCNSVTIGVIVQTNQIYKNNFVFYEYLINPSEFVMNKILMNKKFLGNKKIYAMITDNHKLCYYLCDGNKIYVGKRNKCCIIFKEVQHYIKEEIINIQFIEHKMCIETKKNSFICDIKNNILNAYTITCEIPILYTVDTVKSEIKTNRQITDIIKNSELLFDQIVQNMIYTAFINSNCELVLIFPKYMINEISSTNFINHQNYNIINNKLPNIIKDSGGSNNITGFYLYRVGEFIGVIMTTYFVINNCIVVYKYDKSMSNCNLQQMYIKRTENIGHEDHFIFASKNNNYCLYSNKKTQNNLMIKNSSGIFIKKLNIEFKIDKIWYHEGNFYLRTLTKNKTTSNLICDDDEKKILSYYKYYICKAENEQPTNNIKECPKPNWILDIRDGNIIGTDIKNLSQNLPLDYAINTDHFIAIIDENYNLILFCKQHRSKIKNILVNGSKNNLVDRNKKIINTPKWKIIDFYV